MVSIKHVLVGMLRSTRVNISWYHTEYVQKSKEDKKNSESNQDRKENVVSKTASQVGDVVKQIVQAGSSVSAQLEDKL